MAKPPRRVTPEMQEAADLRELMGIPAFRRFLFTVMARSGISGVAYGSEVVASYHEGRRSLGLDILRMADDTLAVRTPEGLPFAVMSLITAEVLRSTPVEQPDHEDTIDPDFDERR